MPKLPLPIRIPQKKSETKSFAIVSLKLGELGIFRGQTENDYGIDVDLELENEGAVTGRSVKIQVKSSVDLKLRKDGTPAVGGIKQTTLNYWCQIAFHTNVIAYAVDLATQNIYVSVDLFWQATCLIDGGQSTKSITFGPEGENNIATAKYLTVTQALQPTISEVRAAHTLALRRLKSFLTLLADAFHYDVGSELHEPDDFRDLLHACSVLLWNDGETSWADKRDQHHWQSYEYWKAKSEDDGWDGVSYLAAQPVLTNLVPALVLVLRTLRERVIAGKYFWAHQDSSYLALVYETTIPDTTDKEELIDWSYQYDQRRTVVQGMGSYFAQRARTPTLKKKSGKLATRKNSVDL